MPESKPASKEETLLIYLPCYRDYRQAIMQAERIRGFSKDNIHLDNFKIEVMISCNGVDISPEEVFQISDLTDYKLLMPFGISGDINITQGFMHAIRLEADYLWILSANDVVGESFVETILKGLVQAPGMNLLVGCTSQSRGHRKVRSVFDLENKDIPFGLISAVVYRTRALRENFDSAMQMNWTGWGQLATIEASCIALGGLNVSVVSEQALYERSVRGLKDETKEHIRIRNAYAHSFFGMPIVISALHSGNPKNRKKFLNNWVRTNWYLVNYFLNTDFKLWSQHIASNQSWLRGLAFSSVQDASFFYRTLFLISRFTNVYKWRNLKIAQFARELSRGRR
jgi:hypothetical protein